MEETNVEKSISELEEKVNEMKNMQAEIDRKTKDAAAYKKSNEWLVSIIKCSVISIVIFLSIVVAVIGVTIMHVTTEYFNYEQGITREYTSETNSVESGDNGIMFYKSDGNTNSVDGR